jgi:hypothetical protein
MDAAKDLLKRAVELDSAQRYSEALICYEEGIQNLLRVMGGCSEEEKKELRKKAEEYLARAEVLKQEARDGDVATEKVRCVQVRPGDKGHSYSSVFGGCMDGNVESISVRDPYIRARHQLHNFVRFCELAVRNCRRLKAICLITGREPQTEVRREEECETGRMVSNGSLFYVLVATGIISERVRGEFKGLFGGLDSGVFRHSSR